MSIHRPEHFCGIPKAACSLEASSRCCWNLSEPSQRKALSQRARCAVVAPAYWKREKSAAGRMGSPSAPISIADCPGSSASPAQSTAPSTQSSMQTSTCPLSASMFRCSSSAAVMRLRMSTSSTTGPSGSQSSH
eukprot:1488853-Rhodomonas_salina.1